MLNTLDRRAAKGERPSPGMRIGLPTGPLVEMVAVEQPDVYLTFAGANLR
ncbi:hypothetical protein [Mycobacterium sp. IEC1808]|nr:hypothetical protein [Mycobacterium sp. IEC1808]